MNSANLFFKERNNYSTDLKHAEFQLIEESVNYLSSDLGRYCICLHQLELFPSLNIFPAYSDHRGFKNPRGKLSGFVAPDCLVHLLIARNKSLGASLRLFESETVAENFVRSALVLHAASLSICRLNLSQNQNFLIIDEIKRFDKSSYSVSEALIDMCFFPDTDAADYPLSF